jgi:hypothetical protein
LYLFFDNVNETKRNHKEKKMRFFWQLFGLLFIGYSLIFAGGAENPRVTIKTELGDITIEIYEKEAPITAANFLKYVDEGRYKNGYFYRAKTSPNWILRANAIRMARDFLPLASW